MSTKITNMSHVVDPGPLLGPEAALDHLLLLHLGLDDDDDDNDDSLSSELIRRCCNDGDDEYDLCFDSFLFLFRSGT